jgi:hypothetical protein
VSRGLIVVDGQHQVISSGSMLQDWQVIAIEPGRLTLQYQQQQRHYILGCANGDICDTVQWLR